MPSWGSPGKSGSNKRSHTDPDSPKGLRQAPSTSHKRTRTLHHFPSSSGALWEQEAPTLAPGDDPFASGRGFRAQSSHLTSSNSQLHFGGKGGAVAVPAASGGEGDVAPSARTGSGPFQPMVPPERTQVPRTPIPASPTKAAHSTGQQLEMLTSYGSLGAPSASGPPPVLGAPSLRAVALRDRPPAAGSVPMRSGAASVALDANPPLERASSIAGVQTESGWVQGPIDYPSSDSHRGSGVPASAVMLGNSAHSGMLQDASAQLQPPARHSALRVAPGGSEHVTTLVSHPVADSHLDTAAVAHTAAPSSSAHAGMLQNAPSAFPAAQRPGAVTSASSTSGAKDGIVSNLTARYERGGRPTAAPAAHFSSKSSSHAGDATRMQGVTPLAPSGAPHAVAHAGSASATPLDHTTWGREPAASRTDRDDWQPSDAQFHATKLQNLAAPLGETMSVQIDEDADMLSAYSVDHWEHPDPPEELADLPNARMVLDTVCNIRAELRRLNKDVARVNAALATPAGTLWKWADSWTASQLTELATAMRERNSEI
ncbi:hypothetical protein AURDEDRAFT_177332 [Auricularia subglabra TFB-10046 SS5]|uniref:Uncharacterized protein n=1 Tax=Auricularia subglabra (strain TFB-10046 / SS5) TaxID=717982 RepID=J0LAY6_AURST|nr:hypothetical protein AURDEDRAFT_177332 [Auricularia subglabra TFB-10046 SS5]